MSRPTLAALAASALSLSAAFSMMVFVLGAEPAWAQSHAPRAAGAAAHNAAALTGPLAIGATVRDGAGETLGRVSRLTTGADGQTMVMLRKGVDTFSVPASALQLSGGGVISSLSRSDIKALGSSAAH